MLGAAHGAGGHHCRLRHGGGRRQVGHDGAAEARALERAEREPAADDVQADASVLLDVEVRVRLQEGQALALRPAGEAVDEVVAVALDVGQAEQGDERQVLLDGRPACVVRSSPERKNEPRRPRRSRCRQRARLTSDL